MDYYDTTLAESIEKLKEAYRMHTAFIIQRMDYLYKVMPSSTIVTWNPEEYKFELKIIEPEECIKLRKRMQDIWEQEYEPRIKDLIEKYGRRSSR